MSADYLCTECGAKCIEYDEHWNMRYTAMLVKVFKPLGVGIPVRPRDLGQFKDIQRVTYSYGKHFGVIEKVYRDDGTERRGWWQLTNFGDAFLHGLAAVPARVTTFRNEVIDRSEEEFFIQESPPWKNVTYESVLMNSRVHSS